MVQEIWYVQRIQICYSFFFSFYTFEITRKGIKSCLFGNIQSSFFFLHKVT